jgi:hypothetical protein
MIRRSISAVGALLLALTFGLTLAGGPAQADTVWSLTPPTTNDGEPVKGVKAPKGIPLQGSQARVAPTPQYHYAGGYQYVESDGAQVNCNIHDPYLNSKDAHTLCEIAVQSSDGAQVVEFGWTKDATVCAAYQAGSDGPCLFGFHWVNGVRASAYNSGFVDYGSNPIDLGDTMSVTGAGQNARFTIQVGANDWWLGLDPGDGTGANYVASIAKTTWSSASPSVTFDKAGLIQVFGEVAAKDTTLGGDAYPCSDVGNGQEGKNSNSANNPARLGTFSLINATGGTAASLSPTATSQSFPGKYYAEAVTGTTTTMYYGGPGFNSVDDGPGATGSCAPGAEGVPAASSLQVWKEACPDGAAVTGCNSAWSVPWSTAVVNQCHAVTGADDDFRRVWNNSLSSGKAFYVYATTTCGSTRTLVTNASKVVTAWDIHGWARAS